MDIRSALCHFKAFNVCLRLVMLEQCKKTESTFHWSFDQGSIFLFLQIFYWHGKIVWEYSCSHRIKMIHLAFIRSSTLVIENFSNRLIVIEALSSFRLPFQWRHVVHFAGTGHVIVVDRFAQSVPFAIAYAQVQIINWSFVVNDMSSCECRTLLNVSIE